MVENIQIGVNVDSSKLKTLRSELKELTNDMGSLKEGTDEWVATSNKILEVKSAINEVTAASASCSSATETLTSESDSLASSQTTVKDRLREVTIELTNMKAAGLDNTETYKQLIAEAGNLKDAMGDVNAEIKDAGNDTQALSNVIDVFAGVDSAAGAVIGTMSTLGINTGVTEKAMEKMVGVMTTLQSLEKIQNSLLDKSSGLYKLLNVFKAKDIAQTQAQTTATVAQTAATNGASVASKAAAVAQGIWNAVMAANPIMLIVTAIAALVAGIALFVGASKEEEEAEKEKTKAHEEYIDSLNKEIEATQELLKQKYLDDQIKKLNSIDKKQVEILQHKNDELKIQRDLVNLEMQKAYAQGETAKYAQLMIDRLKVQNQISANAAKIEEIAAKTENKNYRTDDDINRSKQAAENARKAVADAQKDWNKFTDGTLSHYDQELKKIEDVSTKQRANLKLIFKEGTDEYKKAMDQVDKWVEDATKKAEEEEAKRRQAATKAAFDNMLKTTDQAIEDNDPAAKNAEALLELQKQFREGDIADYETYLQRVEDLSYQHEINEIDRQNRISQAKIDAYAKELENYRFGSDEYIALQEKIDAETAAITDRTAKRNDATFKKEQKDKERAAKENKKWSEMELKDRTKVATSGAKITADAINNVSGLMKEGSTEQKAISVAGATMSTFESAVNAYNSASEVPVIGYILGPIAAAGAIAAGLANVNSILAVDPTGEEKAPNASQATSSLSAPSVNQSSAAALTDVTNLTSTVLGDEVIGSMRDTRVYVTEGDITSTQNKVAVMESQNNF